ncbi:DUF1858 domain-containing protein [Chloroflexota bacterium]
MINGDNTKTSDHMEINLNTRVYDILMEYGDIAEVMEVFGVKRVGRYSIRKILTRLLTVKRAAFVHRIPPDKFMKMVQNAVKSKDKSGGNYAEPKHS